MMAIQADHIEILDWLNKQKCPSAGWQVHAAELCAC
jgi:hypothetical protein